MPFPVHQLWIKTVRITVKEIVSRYFSRMIYMYVCINVYYPGILFPPFNIFFLFFMFISKILPAVLIYTLYSTPILFCTYSYTVGVQSLAHAKSLARFTFAAI